MHDMLCRVWIQSFSARFTAFVILCWCSYYQTATSIAFPDSSSGKPLFCVESHNGEPYSTTVGTPVLQVVYRSIWIWELENKATQIWTCHVSISGGGALQCKWNVEKTKFLSKSFSISKPGCFVCLSWAKFGHILMGPENTRLLFRIGEC